MHLLFVETVSNFLACGLNLAYRSWLIDNYGALFKRVGEFLYYTPNKRPLSTPLYAMSNDEFAYKQHDIMGKTT